MGLPPIYFGGNFVGYAIDLDSIFSGNCKYSFYYYKNYRNNYECSAKYCIDDDAPDNEGIDINAEDKEELKTEDKDKKTPAFAIKLLRKTFKEYLIKHRPELKKENLPNIKILCNSYARDYETFAVKGDCLIFWGKKVCRLRKYDDQIEQNDNYDEIEIDPLTGAIKIISDFKFPPQSRQLFVDFLTHFQLTYCQEIENYSNEQFVENRAQIEEELTAGFFGQIIA